MKRRTRTSQDNFSSSNRINKKFLTVLAFVTIILGGLSYLYFISLDLPSLQQLEAYKPKLASKVYSADLKLIDEFYEEKRSFVPIEEMPEMLKKAVIATEDRKFYDHWGINLQRLVRVAVASVITLDFKPRAISTVTQQLARQLYLTLERSVTRKIREAITAVQIERTYTKEEILEMYLNHMNFGHGAYGAQSASLKYFAKNVQELTVDECALLVGLLKAPAHYTPLRHPEKSLRRRNVILSAMREMGDITEEEYAKYSKKPIEVVKSKDTVYGLAPYFTEYVRQIMEQKYGHNLYTDGLSIYTTLDSRAQALAEEVVETHMKDLSQSIKEYYTKRSNFKDLLDPKFLAKNSLVRLLRDSTFVDSVITKKATPEVALVSINPTNGHILAFVGGRDFSKSKFNRVVQARRQPGSAFKPFVYTVAIDNGFSTTHEVLNQPVVTFMPNDERWTPRNYDLSTGGPTTFREGLRKSYNLVTIRVLQNVIQKPKLVVDLAHQMGINSPLDAVPSIALGSSGVTPLEITSAYGVFANGGVLVEPTPILRVEDKNGNIIEQVIPNSREALRKETAYIMTDMLRTVIDHGTGQSARWKYSFMRPAGGKTGTTNDFSDAWFIGFTPQIATGIWVGMDDYGISLGNKRDGASTVMPMWGPYMKKVHEVMELPEVDFPMPSGVNRVELCMDTKMLANNICPNKAREVFFSEFVPTEQCKEHINLNRDRFKQKKDKRRGRF